MSAAPSIVEALATEVIQCEAFRRVLRDVVSEMLAARPEAAELVPIATFAREHSLHEATVRQMAKDGRIEAVRIGKRQWRVRRDSPIGQPMARGATRGATSADTPAERARRLVEKLK
jgi:excisionase family DNA binding protein